MHVIIRSRDAGCFAGELKSRNGDEVELVNARRLWYWDGAASLSQLAQSGTTKPTKCQFPEPVEHIIVLGVCEVIDLTDEARATIDAVPVWRA